MFALAMEWTHARVEELCIDNYGWTKAEAKALADALGLVLVKCTKSAIKMESR